MITRCPETSSAESSASLRRMRSSSRSTSPPRALRESKTAATSGGPQESAASEPPSPTTRISPSAMPAPNRGASGASSKTSAASVTASSSSPGSKSNENVWALQAQRDAPSAPARFRRASARSRYLSPPSGSGATTPRKLTTRRWTIAIRSGSSS